MHKRRSDFALSGANGCLYAMGTNGIVERYDPWKNCWMEVIRYQIVNDVSLGENRIIYFVDLSITELQIGAFGGSNLMASVIEIDRSFYAITKGGRIGRMVFGTYTGSSSFSQLSTSEYGSAIGGLQILFRN